MTRVLGIDGGGTSTRAVILDGKGNLLGSGQGGPSNYNSVGLAQSQVNVGEAVDAARREAGMDQRPFDAVFFGMAGVVSPLDHARIRSIGVNLGLAAVERIGVDHDCRIALAAPTGKAAARMSQALRLFRVRAYGRKHTYIEFIAVEAILVYEEAHFIPKYLLRLACEQGL